MARTTPAERAARGRAIRARVPRREHGDWAPAPGRRDPVELLEEQGRSRVPELVPIRYERMLASPFAFFRGGAYLMAADLADAPRTGLEVQPCGDAHLSNFGGFAAPDRRVVISVNDFDETLPGPFEWDVKRLAASFAVAGRDRDFDARQRATINRTVVRAYREATREFASMRTLDLWYLRLEADAVAERFGARVGREAHKRFRRNLSKAEGKDSLRALAKLTRLEDGRARLISDPPLIVPIEEIAGGSAFEHVIRDALRAYRRTLAADRRRLLDRFEYAHAARKVVGVGSVGTRAWVVLMTGRDDGDPLFLQFKEAQASVLEPFLGKSRHAHHGQRVVEGQRLMEWSSDILLGWTRHDGIDGAERDFYVRQLWDRKGSRCSRPWSRRQRRRTAASAAGRSRAAHAHSGDAAAIASYLGGGDSFDLALGAFAEDHADQNERDHRAVGEAVSAGRVTAGAGPEPAPGWAAR